MSDKKFTIEEQVYICKNANSKTLEQLAIATLSTISDVKKEYNAMKEDGRYEKYRRMSDEEVKEIKNKKYEQENEEEENNTLLELNKILFNELRVLRNDTQSEEELNRNLKLSKQVVSVSQTIINNANLLLQAKKHIDTTKEENNKIAPLLSLGENNE